MEKQQDHRVGVHKKRSKDKKIRITLDLSPQFYERLAALQDLVESDSKASLIKQALQLYEYVAQKTAEGYTFEAIDPNGKEERLVFINPCNILS